MKPMFFQITKVDEEKRLVTGQACAEVPDRAGEIFDYATSKPYFEAWSAQCAEDSGGKSLGNVRSMHGNVAAGKLTAIDFDDAAKAINVTSKVVDDNEWQKVLEGVHTGYSIGGEYVKRWDDGDLTRYTAAPSEISLVDRPCIPTAKFFDVIKADGSVLRKAFKESAMNPGQTAVTVDELTDEMAAMLKAGDLNEGDMLAAIKVAREHKRLDELALGKKDYSDDERAKMAESGEAMSDGSFPIKSGKDLNNAVEAHGRAKDPEKAKAHIKSRAKDLGMEDQLPDDWKDGADDASKVGKATSPDGTSSMSTAQPAQADNMAANAPGGRSESEASVTMLEAPKIGAVASFSFGEKSFQGKITATGDTVTVECEGGTFTAAKESFSQAEPGSGVDFAITGEMSRKADLPTKEQCFKVAGAALRKGMYGVSSFASILGSIHYLQQDTQWEADYEGDESDLPAKIKQWMADGCKLLVAMVTEECKELVGDPAEGNVDFYIGDEVLFLAAQSGELGKAAAMKYAVLSKIARNGGDLKKLAGNADLVKGLQDKVEKLGGQVEKAATTAADLRKQLATKGDELAKVAKERDEAVAKANKLESERQAPRVMAVAKGDDLGGTGEVKKVDPVKDSFGKVDEAASAFKQIHKSGPTAAMTL